MWCHISIPQYILIILYLNMQRKNSAVTLTLTLKTTWQMWTQTLAGKDRNNKHKTLRYFHHYNWLYRWFLNDTPKILRELLNTKLSWNKSVNTRLAMVLQNNMGSNTTVWSETCHWWNHTPIKHVSFFPTTPVKNIFHYNKHSVSSMQLTLEMHAEIPRSSWKVSATADLC